MLPGRQRFELLAALIAAPVLLVAVGYWEASRAPEAVAYFEGMAEALPQKVAELRALAVSDKYASVDLGDEVRYAPGLAANMLEEMEPAARRGLFLAKLQPPLALAAILGGLLALAGGLGGLAFAEIAARRARASRGTLVASFAALQRALPIILGTMVAGLSLAIASSAAFEAIGLASSMHLSKGDIKLMVAAVILGAGALMIAWSAMRSLLKIGALYNPEQGTVHGRLVTDRDAPALWRFVRDVAKRQQAIAPDAVIVGMEGGFFVTEQDLRLLPGDTAITGRTLYLPAPYLAFLSEGETTAIVGHELSHFTGEDTRYSQLFAPLYAGMQRTLAAIAEEAGNTILLRGPLLYAAHAMQRFDHSVQHWSRLREFEADRLGAGAEGRRHAASALVRTTIVAPPVGMVLSNVFQDPDRGDEDLVGTMIAQVEKRGWPDVGDHLADSTSHPTDSHPPTSERIRRLDIAVDEVLLAEALRPPKGDQPSAGERLIADWHGLCRKLSADFSAQAQAAHGEHRAFLEETAAAVSREGVTLLNDTRLMVGFQFTAATVLAAAGIAAWIFQMPLGLAGLPAVILTGACLAGCAVTLVAGLLVRRSAHVPFLVLYPEHLATPRLSETIAWREIEEWTVTYGNRFGLDLVLADSASLPRVTGAGRFTKVYRKKRELRIGGYGVRGMKVDAFAELVGSYIAADRARQALDLS
nr:M48 family metalloprotease [uncultured Novosphingobium sp.]